MLDDLVCFFSNIVCDVKRYVFGLFSVCYQLDVMIGLSGLQNCKVPVGQVTTCTV